MLRGSLLAVDATTTTPKVSLNTFIPLENTKHGHELDFIFPRV
jgi:hypothetical protein